MPIKHVYIYPSLWVNKWHKKTKSKKTHEKYMGWNKGIEIIIGCNYYLISIVVSGYLNWCWIFWMNLYNNIFNILWEHFANFEMNLISMEYPKAFSKQCIYWFSMPKGFFLKNWNDFKMTFVWKQNMQTFAI
jgi:hypothetical protein